MSSDSSRICVDEPLMVASEPLESTRTLAHPADLGRVLSSDRTNEQNRTRWVFQERSPARSVTVGAVCFISGNRVATTNWPILTDHGMVDGAQIDAHDDTR
jgi:hypothetical protein